MGLFYGNVALGGGGLILVDALPTANATEYNKHNLYLYNGEIYYITEDSGTYDYEKLPEKSSAQSYQVTFTASGTWTNQSLGYVKIYDGQDTTGTLLLDQNPALKSAYPITLTISSGYCCVDLYGPAFAPGTDVTSEDYGNSPSGLGYWQFTIDKDGSLDIYIGDFDD